MFFTRLGMITVLVLALLGFLAASYQIKSPVARVMLSGSPKWKSDASNHIDIAIELMNANDPTYVSEGKAHLEKAAELGKGTPTGEKAKRFLRCNWPVEPVPNEVVLLHTQAIASSDIKKSDELWRECIRRCPSFEHPQSCLAMHLIFLEGKKDEGVKILENLIKTKPNYVRPYVRLSQMEEQEGHYKKALNYIECAMKLNPDDFVVSDQAYRLRSLRKLARFRQQENSD
jgi:hypothetical protein